MSRKLLHVGNGHQIRRAADGGTETADAAAPANCQQNRCGLPDIRVLAAVHKLQHVCSNGAKNRRYHHVRQKDGENYRSSQPRYNLLPHGRADTA